MSVTQGALTCSEIFTGVTVTCMGSNQVIRITLSSSINAISTLRFQIQGFTNPSSTQPTSQFSVTSYNSAGITLESSQLLQNPTLTATADTTTSRCLLLILATSFMVNGTSPVESVSFQCESPCASCCSNSPSKCLSCISTLSPEGKAYLL